jgi:hypothetical protein
MIFVSSPVEPKYKFATEITEFFEKNLQVSARFAAILLV